MKPPYYFELNVADVSTALVDFKLQMESHDGTATGDASKGDFKYEKGMFQHVSGAYVVHGLMIEVAVYETPVLSDSGELSNEITSFFGGTLSKVPEIIQPTQK